MCVVTQRSVEATCSAEGLAGADCRPLSRVPAGSLVRIRELRATPDLCKRLREMGLCERQQIRILLQDKNVVCQVCNTRLGLSGRLADKIIVEPIQTRRT